MSDNDVVGWVFDDKDGGRWAVQADSKEAAMEIFTKTAPSKTSIVDEHTIPSADAARYQLEQGKAVQQAKA
ncbi:hypothetical protein [Chenggangzhangella methanolivorans]|uniref:Uncharacterized protein n=1 Tax=Chenggangzhangella methanolivorans TaxID=1437009 RepID=A0A9E6UP08_9HYPH|nr:hypothetical protein [Chenggangzhangella methanolivorans]QZO01726.1 hypothetical protein K6K41_10300 [Chenggangzhangella methanolivorans]